MDPSDSIWLSAAEANDMWEDAAHFGSTVDNLEQLHHASEGLRCWQLARIDSLAVDPRQLWDEPDNAERTTKIASIRASIASGEALPPVWLVHHLEDEEYPWELLEGHHRYNAAHAERTDLLAWVAHIGCCGGPPADLPW